MLSAASEHWQNIFFTVLCCVRLLLSGLNQLAGMHFPSLHLQFLLHTEDPSVWFWDKSCLLFPYRYVLRESFSGGVWVLKGGSHQAQAPREDYYG